MTSTRWPLALALAAVLAGCGGGDALDREALADRANEICDRYAERGRELGRPDLADPDVAREYFGAAEALAREQQDELEALEPAEDVAAQFAALTEVTEKATVLLGEIAAADAEQRSELLNQLPILRVEVDDAAGAIGADACAG